LNTSHQCSLAPCSINSSSNSNSNSSSICDDHSTAESSSSMGYSLLQHNRDIARSAHGCMQA
jgi:hypothetical protein